MRFGWLLEIAVLGGAYLLYNELRDRALGTTRSALHHARQVVTLERWTLLYQERRVQQAFLRVDWFIAWWNIYYGMIHFVVPVIALVILYRKAPARYVRWRNTLVLLLALGLLGFWVYPLMPPRLMPPRYHFVDTAAEYFNFGPQQRVRFRANGEPTEAARRAFGNPYAAMPSLHVGWATWSAFALLPLARRRWLQVLLCCYPLVTIFAIVVTANHWLLDALGGWAALALAYGIVVLAEHLPRRWRTRLTRAGGSRVPVRAGPRSDRALNLRVGADRYNPDRARRAE